MSRKKVGLALGGGAARGMAHVGVLEVLEEAGIPVDMIAGTSAGALVGALYAKGRSAGSIKEQVISMNWRRAVGFIDITLPRTGFIEGRRFNRLLRETVGGEIQFSDLGMPLAVVATDILTGEEVVMHDGPVLEAVRASISIPIVFSVPRTRGRYLVDGGLVNPVPVSVVRDMGADVIIAVNVIPAPAELLNAERMAKPRGRRLTLTYVTVQSFYIAAYVIAVHGLKGADVLIQPRVAHIHPYDFLHARECVELGAAATKAALPEIERVIGK